MSRQTITSTQNSKIKLANKLRNKRHREREQLFVVDDGRDLRRALSCDYQPEFLFYCADYASEDDDALVAGLEDVVIYEIAPELMDKAAYRQNPGGVVAIMQQKPALGIADVPKSDTHILGLVNLRKPGNIGALLRTADAAGIGLIFLVDTSLDLYNPNIIRSSTGANFLGNIVQITGADMVAYCHENDIRLAAAHLDGNIDLYDYDFSVQRTAVLLGTEDTGLDDTWVNHSDVLLKIPMVGQLSDSLNVSVSGAIMMYEALRQRQS